MAEALLHAEAQVSDCRIPSSHLAALRTLYQALDTTAVNWVVTGSLGLALQGLPVTPDDIDIQTDAAGAYEIGRLFARHVVRPVAFSSTERIRSHFGALSLEGVEVEIMGDIQKRADGGEWEAPADLDRYKHFVDLEGMRMPVLSLGFERRAYALLGRRDKAGLIEEWLAGNDRLTKPRNSC